ncbi:hypothetical protein NKJ16_03625 [Mesorhizobium sp. M0179]|uniref:hypothetical protein n=1 Tax=unclassified Mesorhizobium TaxID=325217 RepID=UPI0003CE3A66|nr:hypothetical protein [Mesorhizobium sp. LSJC265A00]ESX11034.1 hypothetical protein X768_12710 [Mesorhizobium sp. LSJC265A00]
MPDQREPPFTVVVFDMAKTGEHVVSGFETLDAATSYAIGRVRASVEELRKPGIAAAELRRHWHIHGEDCTVLNANVRGSDLLDDFIATPGTPAECDWRALAPRLRRFYAAVNVFNNDGKSIRVSGFFRATYRLWHAGLLARFGDDAIASFKAKGITPAVPTRVSVDHHFEQPDPPRPPPSDIRPLLSWKVEIDFGCTDVRFGAKTDGVFAWPEEPTGRALNDMTHLLMADRLSMYGTGPEGAYYSELVWAKVTETDAAADYPLD